MLPHNKKAREKPGDLQNIGGPANLLSAVSTSSQVARRTMAHAVTLRWAPPNFFITLSSHKHF